VAVRYKQPADAESSVLQERFPLESTPFDQASGDLRFASAVAAFGLLLRGSAHKGTATYGDVLAWARSAVGDDEHGDRTELLELVTRAQSIARAWRDDRAASAPPGEPVRMTLAIFMVEHGDAAGIFRRLRGLLVRDPERAGNILYVPGSQLILLVDRASRLADYQALVDSLDVAPSVSRSEGAAGAGQ